MKRGGRDSGGVPADSTKGPLRVSANPAAPDVARMEARETEVAGASSAHHKMHHERIRAIEADLQMVSDGFNEMEHRAEKAEDRSLQHREDKEIYEARWLKSEAEVERLKALIKQFEDALKACIDETPAYETD